MRRDTIIGPPISQPLCQRYGALIWSLLDAGLHKSALFYAERYFVEDVQNHDARHLYATALIEAGQPHSAHRLVNVPAKGDAGCTGCLHVLAQCCMKLGRHRQAREALEGCLRDSAFVPSRAYSIVAPSARRASYVCAGSMGQRTASAFPDAATLCCQAGNSALKGNLHESAAMSYRQALALNPMIWEAFEGLCAIGAFALASRGGHVCRSPSEKCAGDVTSPALRLYVHQCPGNHTIPAHIFAGTLQSCPPCGWLTLIWTMIIGDIPPIDNLFPPRPEPVLQKPGEEGPSRPVPVATGAGFFTPEAGSAGNLFRDWKPGLKAMDAAAGPRDSM